MRLFVAANLTPQVRGLIAAQIENFPVRRPSWRWTQPDTWHVTLKFIGETPEDDVPLIETCLELIAARHRAFALTLRAFGGFPDLRRPRVLFYKVETGAEPLTQLAADIETGFSDELGIPREDRPFRAHVTIARVKTPLPPEVTSALGRVPALEGAAQTISFIDLMKSELQRGGAQYQRLKQFALVPSP